MPWPSSGAPAACVYVGVPASVRRQRAGPLRLLGLTAYCSAALERVQPRGRVDVVLGVHEQLLVVLEADADAVRVAAPGRSRQHHEALVVVRVRAAL
ncbi:hypothetical protein ON010_g5010 [Phytophthora cinnamomi]|nr:hypothetical protein ON010_g5010 [Phytophthora cinnamomi]